MSASSEPAHDPVEVPEYLRCIHCGLCTSACPTYLETGKEPDSPRGRIHLIRALDEGRIDWTDDVVGHLEGCLDCQACVTACPSGVEYGRLIEDARETIETKGLRPGRDQRILRLLRDGLFPHRRRLRLALAPLRLLAAIPGALWLARRIPGLPGRMARMVPQTLLHRKRRPRTRQIRPARNHRLQRGRVLLLEGCVGSALYAHVNEATAAVLERNGFEVIVPANQGCCGALHVHTGAREDARRYARRLIDAFEAAAGEKGLNGVEAVIVNAAGCGSTMKHYAELLADDEAYAERAAAFTAKVRDVHEFLDGIDLAPLPKVDVVVTYHDACHLIHGQGIAAAPRRLLARIPGLRLVPLEESGVCCGSAGVYNLTHTEMADDLRERKLKHIHATGARIVATGNPGCALQIAAGAEDARMPVEVVHPVELLHRAYQSEALPDAEAG